MSMTVLVDLAWRDRHRRRRAGLRRIPAGRVTAEAIGRDRVRDRGVCRRCSLCSTDPGCILVGAARQAIGARDVLFLAAGTDGFGLAAADFGLVAGITRGPQLCDSAFGKGAHLSGRGGEVPTLKVAHALILV